MSIRDTQPVTAEGIRNVLAASGDLQFLQSPASLSQAREFVRLQAPDVLVIDKAFGIQAILDFLTEAGHTGNGRARTNIVIWGVSVTEAEALRFSPGGREGDSAKDRCGACRAFVLAHGGGGADLDGRFGFSRRPPYGSLPVHRADNAGATGSRVGRTKLQK